MIILLDKCIFSEYIYNDYERRKFQKDGNMNIKKNILRFTVSMDKDLLDELLRLTEQKKKSRTFDVACREFVRMKQKENLLDLKGKLKSGG